MSPCSGRRQQHNNNEDIMTQHIEQLREQNKLRLIAGAIEHLELEGIACATIPLPGTKRVLAIGEPAAIERLLAQAAQEAAVVATPSTAAVRAAALKEAAHLCECIGTDWLDANDAHKNFAADYLAKEIRALINTPAADGGNGGEG
jgi:hypothetical protein